MKRSLLPLYSLERQRQRFVFGFTLASIVVPSLAMGNQLRIWLVAAPLFMLHLMFGTLIETRFSVGRSPSDFEQMLPVSARDLLRTKLVVLLRRWGLMPAVVLGLLGLAMLVRGVPQAEGEPILRGILAYTGFALCRAALGFAVEWRSVAVRLVSLFVGLGLAVGAFMLGALASMLLALVGIAVFGGVWHRASSAKLWALRVSTADQQSGRLKTITVGRFLRRLPSPQGPFATAQNFFFSVSAAISISSDPTAILWASMLLFIMLCPFGLYWWGRLADVARIVAPLPIRLGPRLHQVCFSLLLTATLSIGFSGLWQAYFRHERAIHETQETLELRRSWVAGQIVYALVVPERCWQLSPREAHEGTSRAERAGLPLWPGSALMKYDPSIPFPNLNDERVVRNFRQTVSDCYGISWRDAEARLFFEFASEPGATERRSPWPWPLVKPSPKKLEWLPNAVFFALMFLLSPLIVLGVARGQLLARTHKLVYGVAGVAALGFSSMLALVTRYAFISGATDAELKNLDFTQVWQNLVLYRAHVWVAQHAIEVTLVLLLACAMVWTILARVASRQELWRDIAWLNPAFQRQAVRKGLKEL